MAQATTSYPATLDIEYPPKLDRFSTFLRLFFVIPIFIILSLVSGSFGNYSNPEHSSMSNDMQTVGSQEDMFAYGVRKQNTQERSFNTPAIGIAGGLSAATALMIIFRQRYPRWWFNFALELSRFSTRVSAYMLLLTDRYPSTEDAQAVHLEIAYPDAKKDINRWLPLVKWLLALPHYIALFILIIGVFFATIIAWFAILITGRYPESLFQFVVGVLRWSTRVNAYAFLLTTDIYPPFSTK